MQYWSLKKGFTPPPINYNSKATDEYGGDFKGIRSSYCIGRAMVAGFTMVELLVVIAIITLIASLALVQIQSTRMRARDAEREQEIKTLQNALAIYVVNYFSHPVYTGALTGSDPASLELINKDAISIIPLDPLNTGNFRYLYGSTDGSTYTLTYYLETNSIPGKSAGVQEVGP